MIKASEAKTMVQAAINKKHSKVFEAITNAANDGRSSVYVIVPQYEEDDIIKVLRELGYKINFQDYTDGFKVSW